MLPKIMRIYRIFCALNIWRNIWLPQIDYSLPQIDYSNKSKKENLKNTQKKKKGGEKERRECS